MTQVKINELILRFLKFGADHKHPICMWRGKLVGCEYVVMVLS